MSKYFKTEGSEKHNTKITKRWEQRYRKTSIDNKFNLELTYSKKEYNLKIEIIGDICRTYNKKSYSLNVVIDDLMGLGFLKSTGWTSKHFEHKIIKSNDLKLINNLIFKEKCNKFSVKQNKKEQLI